MRFFQSSIEKLLYILLFLVFIVASIGAIGTILSYKTLLQQQKNFHNESAANLAIIEANQAKQAKDIRIYIDCLIHIDVKGDVASQEKTCFDKAPYVQ